MKIIFASLLLAITAFTPVAEEIDWYVDIKLAVEAARESDSIIMIDFYTDWCHWCKKLDKEVYTDPAVVKISKRLVSLKLDAEDKSYGQRLAALYRVQGYPTILFIKVDGSVVGKIGGYLPAPMFAVKMNSILASASK